MGNSDILESTPAFLEKQLGNIFWDIDPDAVKESFVGERLREGMRTEQKKTMVIGICVVLLLVFCITAFWHGLTVKTYDISTDKITSCVRIAVLSDLHDCNFGKFQKDLIEKIRHQGPDMILLTGDIADDKKTHDATEQLLSVIGSEYACFYVSGNHEIWSGQSHKIKDLIRSFGVMVLEGGTEIVSIGDQNIVVAGVDDPEEFYPFYRTDRTKGESFYDQLNACNMEIDDSTFSVLLSHRPELINEYKSSGFDLVASGHSHGGQIRIPYIFNGVYAPNQGFFPKYAGGYYQLDDKALIVSRGLSKSVIPRVFNPPELVIVNLIPKK